LVVLHNSLTAILLEGIYWKSRNILVTLKVHVLGLRNFQKVQKERHSSDLALHMIQMEHWVLRRLKMGPEELALPAHRSSETADRKHWEHHTYRKEYRRGRKNLHSEHHSCLTVWKALCNSVKEQHMNRKEKARRNLVKVLQELRNLLTVVMDLNTLRYRLIQREC
jgi:hypothetical protein